MITFIHIKDIKTFSQINTSDFTDVYDFGVPQGDSGFVVSDSYDELLQYRDIRKLKPNTNVTLKAKDKLYISKGCEFPPLLLSRLASNGTCDLKRTVKASTADYVVFPSEIDKSPTYFNWRQNTSDHIFCIFIENGVAKFAQPNHKHAGDRTAIEGIHQAMKQHYTQGVYFGLFYRNLSDLENFHMTGNRISELVLMKHVQSQCAKPSDEEWTNLMATIKSTDDEQVKLGWDMLQYYDLSDRYLDLLQILMQNQYSLPTESTRSASMKYVTGQLNIRYKLIKSGYISMNAPLFEMFMQNPLASTTLKSKLIKMMPGSIAASANDAYIKELGIGGLKFTVVSKDTPGAVIENPSYAESQIVSDVLQKISNNRFMQQLEEIMNSYGWKFRIVRIYESN